MKNTVLTILLIIISVTAKPQAVLEHTYHNQYITTAVKLSNSDWIYWSSQYFGQVTCINLYSSNHVLIKSVPLQIPIGASFTRVDNVSDKLFNSDSKIEILYCVQNTGSTPPLFKAYLVNEDGTVLQDFAGVFFSEIINMDGDFKMICSSITDSSTRIYSLPGVMVDLPENQFPEYGFSVFPNPCDSFVDINCPITTKQITIYNVMGIKICQIPANPSSPTRVDTHNLQPGTYIFEAQLPDGKRGSGRFIKEQ
jgi:hypothetical protein